MNAYLSDLYTDLLFIEGDNYGDAYDCANEYYTDDPDDPYWDEDEDDEEEDAYCEPDDLEWWYNPYSGACEWE